VAVRIDPKLKKAYDFFRKHAGSSAKNALELARSEAVAESLGWEVVWEEDQEEYQLGDEEDMPREVLVAILRDQDGEQLELLGGIGDPDRVTGRLIEAELALDALSRKGLL
jgi:hypothetical protein